MILETQKTITAWARETFGGPKLNAIIAARALAEFAEMMMALAIDDNDPKASEEAADVFIVLCQMVENQGRDLLAEVQAKMAINRARKWRGDGHGNGQHVLSEEDARQLEELLENPPEPTPAMKKLMGDEFDGMTREEIQKKIRGEM